MSQFAIVHVNFKICQPVHAKCQTLKHGNAQCQNVVYQDPLIIFLLPFHTNNVHASCDYNSYQIY